MTLTDTERARCSHPERQMAPTGRYSLCSACALEALAGKVLSPEAHGSRGYTRLCFNVPLTRESAASLWYGLFAAGFAAEVAMEPGGRALRVYVEGDDPLDMLSVTEWIAEAGWR